MIRFYGDPHLTLGLTPDATENEVRKAYRRLAMQCHPDRNPDDPKAADKFKEIQWAYETLVRQKDRKSPTPSDQHVRSAHYFSGDTRPFFGFFWAVRNHYAKRKVS